MATEDQIKQLWVDGTNLQNRINECCRDIVMWKSYVRVVAENTSIVVSDWLDNVAVGSTRRGLPFTMEFSLPHDSNKFFDDRSSPDNAGHINSFNVHVTFPDTGVSTEEKISEIVQCANDETVSSLCNFGHRTNGSWIWNTAISAPLTSGLLDGYSGSNPLPAFNTYNTSSHYYMPSGYYYIYKDFTDNKIKIDVKRRDQFADGHYLALFFTQFVLRSGATL